MSAVKPRKKLATSQNFEQAYRMFEHGAEYEQRPWCGKLLQYVNCLNRQQDLNLSSYGIKWRLIIRAIQKAADTLLESLIFIFQDRDVRSGNLHE